MFKFDQLRSVHLEITSKCQASCPMCARNHHGGGENPNLIVTEIDLDKFVKIFSTEVLRQLQHLYLCGNFGDPIMSKDLIPMIEYAVSVNDRLKISIHTNGSARTKQWWLDLAASLPEDHMVHFALDGLEDTHHLYRIGTDFNKIIDNAKTFIGAGGRAEWVFLAFKHNEHQIDTARQMAKDLGFVSFNHKATGRFIHEPVFPVVDQQGEFLYNLEPPQVNNIVFINKEKIKKFRYYVDTAEIHCKVQKDKEIYVDALGHMYPCCFLGSANYLHSPESDIIYDYHDAQKKSLNDFIEYLGGWRAVDLSERSIREVIDSEQWQTAWDIYWNEKKLVTCARICGKWDEKLISQYGDQFIGTESFEND